MKLRMKSASFNPLDFIGANDPLAIDDCNSIASAMVYRSGEEKGDGIHFLDASEMFIAGVTATVVRYGQPSKNTRSLQTVRDILTHPQKLEMALKLMTSSDAWGGMLARIGGQLSHFVDREKASVLTTTGRFTRFLDTLAVAECTFSSSFKPANLRKRRMTVYLVLPPDRMIPGLLRMWIGSLMRACVREGLNERNKVHFVLDEAASLGARLKELEDSVDKYRAYGIRNQFYYQSMGQLKKCWPDDGGQTLLSNATQIFFGVNDQPTSEYVSTRLGEETIALASGGSSRGESWQTSFTGTKGGASYSTNSNTGWQQQARKLLKPDEVLGLPNRVAITFTPGVRPIWTKLVRYYEERRLFKCRGWFFEVRSAVGMLIKSAVVLVVAGAFALLATNFLAKEVSRGRFGGAAFRTTGKVDGSIGSDQGGIPGGYQGIRPRAGERGR